MQQFLIKITHRVFLCVNMMFLKVLVKLYNRFFFAKRRRKEKASKKKRRRIFSPPAGDEDGYSPSTSQAFEKA